jgi:hypothetical protein
MQFNLFFKLIFIKKIIKSMFLGVFRWFWCIDVKNKIKFEKKYHFDTFLIEKHFQKHYALH